MNGLVVDLVNETLYRRIVQPQRLDPHGPFVVKRDMSMVIVVT